MCLVQLVIVASPDSTTYSVAMIGTGFCFGAILSIIATYLVETYGRDNYALNWGCATSASGVFGTIMSYTFGYLYDKEAIEGNCFGEKCFLLCTYICTFVTIVIGVVPGMILQVRATKAK